MYMVAIMVSHYTLGAQYSYYYVFVGANLNAAVHEILLPIMKEIKNDLNSVKDDLSSVKNDLSSLNKTVINLSDLQLVDHKQQTTSEATCTGILRCQVHEPHICMWIEVIYLVSSADNDCITLFS